MLERRKEQRWPAYLGGRLAFPFDRTTCDCLVRSTSTRGARVVLQQAWCLPREFSLQIPCRQVDVRMRACWYRPLDLGFEIGVEAVAAQAADPIDLELERSMHRLDVHNAALKQHLAELNE